MPHALAASEQEPAESYRGEAAELRAEYARLTPDRVRERESWSSRNAWWTLEAFIARERLDMLETAGLA